MKYRAVIFDLFGTLASNFSSQGYNNALMQMATALSLPSDDFRQAWFATSKERNSGAFQNCETDVEPSAVSLRYDPPKDKSNSRYRPDLTIYDMS